MKKSIAFALCLSQAFALTAPRFAHADDCEVLKSAYLDQQAAKVSIATEREVIQKILENVQEARNRYNNGWLITNAGFIALVSVGIPVVDIYIRGPFKLDAKSRLLVAAMGIGGSIAIVTGGGKISIAKKDLRRFTEKLNQANLELEKLENQLELKSAAFQRAAERLPGCQVASADNDSSEKSPITVDMKNID